MKKIVVLVCLFVSSCLATAYANPEYATTSYLSPPDVVCSQCHDDGRTWSMFHNQYDSATNSVHLPVIYVEGAYYSADFVMIQSQPTMRFRVENVQPSLTLPSISLASDHYDSARAIYYEACSLLEINNITVGTQNYRYRRLTFVAGAPGVEFQFTPVTAVSSEELSFGYQLVNGTSASQTVTVSNTGSAPMLISSICLDGADLSQFVIQENTCGESLAEGDECTIRVAFTPTEAGQQNALLSVRVAEPAESKSVALSGTGTSIAIRGTPALITYDEDSGTIHCPVIETATGFFSADLVMVDSQPPFRFRVENLQPSLIDGPTAAVYEEGSAQLLLPNIMVGEEGYMVTLGLVPGQAEAQFELVDVR